MERIGRWNASGAMDRAKSMLEQMAALVLK